MYAATLIYPDLTIPLTPYIAENSTVSWDDLGDNQVNLTVTRNYTTQRIFTRKDIPELVIDYNGAEIWRGKVQNIQRSTDTLTITAYGLLRQLQDIQLRNGYSAVGTSYWKIYTSQSTNVLTGNVDYFIRDEAYNVEVKDNYIKMGAKKGVTIPRYFAGAIATFEFPDTAQNMKLHCTIERFINPRFVVSVDFIDTNRTLTQRYSYSTNGHTSLSLSVPNGTKYITILMYCDVSGGYTVVEENNYWYITIKDLRITPSTDTINTTISSAISSGANRSLPLVNKTGLDVGSTVYFPTSASGETVTISNKDLTNFYGDCIFNHSINASGIIPRFTAQQAITNMASGIGMKPVYYTIPNRDLGDAWYFGANALNTLQSYKDTALIDDKLLFYGTGNNLYVTSSGQLPSYYVRANEFTIEKDFSTYIGKSYASYTTAFDQTRYTPLYDHAAQQRTTATKTVTVDSQYTVSGAVNYDLVRQTTAQSQLTLRSEFNVNTVYNQAGGEIYHPQPQAYVYVRNLLPELEGIDDIVYKLKSYTVDLYSGERTYVIGEYVEDVSTMLASL